jgi:hypothetical protein
LIMPTGTEIWFVPVRVWTLISNRNSLIILVG